MAIKIPHGLTELPVKDTVLLLASYCEDDACTDKLPCLDCLKMCNTATVYHTIIDNHGGYGYQIEQMAEPYVKVELTAQEIELFTQCVKEQKVCVHNGLTLTVSQMQHMLMETQTTPKLPKYPKHDKLSFAGMYGMGSKKLSEIAHQDEAKPKGFKWCKIKEVTVAPKSVLHHGNAKGGTISGSWPKQKTSAALSAIFEDKPTHKAPLTFNHGPEAMVNADYSKIEKKIAKNLEGAMSLTMEKFMLGGTPKMSPLIAGVDKATPSMGKTVYQVSHGGILTTFQNQKEAEKFHNDMLMKYEKYSKDTIEMKTAPKMGGPISDIKWGGEQKKPLKFVSETYLKMVDEAAAKAPKPMYTLDEDEPDLIDIMNQADIKEAAKKFEPIMPVSQPTTVIPNYKEKMQQLYPEYWNQHGIHIGKTQPPYTNKEWQNLHEDATTKQEVEYNCLSPAMKLAYDENTKAGKASLMDKLKTIKDVNTMFDPLPLSDQEIAELEEEQDANAAAVFDDLLTEAMAEDDDEATHS